MCAYASTACFAKKHFWTLVWYQPTDSPTDQSDIYNTLNQRVSVNNEITVIDFYIT